MQRRPPARTPKEKLEPILARLTRRTREQLRAFSEIDERSQSLIIERALQFYFRHHRPEEGLKARLDSLDVGVANG